MTQKITVPVELELPVIKPPQVECPVFIEGLVGAEETAKLLGIQIRTLNDLVSQGRVPYRQVGSLRKYQLTEVLGAFPARRSGELGAES